MKVTYTERSNPPQQLESLFECNVCGALVRNTRLHTEAVHGAAEPQADPRQSAGAVQ